MTVESSSKSSSFLLSEIALGASATTAVLFLLFGGRWLSDLSNSLAIGVNLIRPRSN